MDDFLYTCQYCGKEYKPNRRIKQKYCSNSCRVRAFVVKKNNESNLPSTEISNPTSSQVEKMSWTGVGNAAAGTLAVNALTSLLTKEENKPATKKDLSQLAKTLRKRYHPVRNMPQNYDGTFPYYDLESQTIVYFKNPIISI